MDKKPLYKFISVWLDRTSVKKPSQPTFMNKEDAVFHQMLIEEEISELMRSLPEQRSMNALCDDYFDVLWVVTQAAMMNGINIDDLTRAGARSNLSKFCLSETEAKETVMHYAVGTHPDKKGTKIETYFEKIGDRYVIKRKSDGKILKALSFQQPDFQFITDRMPIAEKEEPKKEGLLKRMGFPKWMQKD